MTTIHDVRSYLDPDEPDYIEAARKLGPDAVSILHDLVRGPDLGLASKATYLASLIESDQSIAVLEDAAKSNEPLLRVAAASTLRNLSEQDADKMMGHIMEDKDVGVRKVILKSIARFKSEKIVTKVQKMADMDPEPFVRGIAAEVIKKMK